MPTLRKRFSAKSCAVALLAAAAVVLLCRDPGLTETATHRAWSARLSGGSDIFYEPPPGTGSVIRVTDGPADDITPALCRDGAGRLHIFWVRQDDGGSRLYASSLVNNVWRAPQILPTGGSRASHPAAVIDGSGVLWLAWTGFDGQDDDIFAMSLKDGVWSPPQRISRDDDVPDLYPVFGLSGDGAPWVYWRGFDGTAYSGYVSRRAGAEWSPEASVGRDDAYRTLIFKELGALNGKARFAEGDGATLFREGAQVPLLPLRLQEVLR